MEAAVETFTSFTGATAEIGRRYLGMTDGNAEQAIQLFFDSPDLASGIAEPTQQSNAPSVPTSSHSRTGREDASGVVHLDSDDDEAMRGLDSDDEVAEASRIAAAARAEEDEAYARRLQEEMYTGGDSGGVDESTVRAPLARTTETLVGGPDIGYEGNDDVHEAVMAQMRARQFSRAAGRGTGVFNQRSAQSIWDESTNPEARRQALSEATGGASESSAKAAKLAELFRPPFELMTQIPWDDARDKGKEEQKWILVNIQDQSLFDCQRLNRDIWKDEKIRDAIKEHFIFMQYSKDDPRANTYIQFYFRNKDSEAAYPHITIIDPRTGEQLKTWSGPPVPEPHEFLMQLFEFTDRYSFDYTKKNPVAKRKAEKPKAVDVDRLTEEEMLELALQNSLATSSGPTGPKDDDPDEMTKSFGDIGKGKGKEVEEEPADLSPFSQISSTHPHTEPTTQGPNVTRIQFRHSTGRIVRKFEVTDPVRRLYEWLKAEPIEGKDGILFELKDRGKDLIEHLDQTIAEAGLKQSTVMVEFLEES